MGGLLPGQGNAREREARLSARARSQAKRGEPLPGRLNAIRREKGSREKGSLIRGNGEIAGEIGGEVGATAVEGAAPVGGGAGDAAEALGGGGAGGLGEGLGALSYDADAALRETAARVAAAAEGVAEGAHSRGLMPPAEYTQEQASLACHFSLPRVRPSCHTPCLPPPPPPPPPPPM